MGLVAFIPRLAVIVAGALLLAACAADASRPDDPGVASIDAHEAQAAGRLLLIDVSQEDEARADGVPAGALHMPFPDGPAARSRFAAALLLAARGRVDAPIAFICRYGVTARAARDYVQTQGFSGATFVADGMLGNESGPGWRQWGLPMDPARPGVIASQDTAR